MNTDYDVFYGHFNRMGIVKVRLLHCKRECKIKCVSYR